MPNEKNHLYSVFDLQKDNRQKEVRGAQQQFSQFSAGKSSSINSANIQSNNIPLQKDNQVAIGIPYNDTNGISGFITVDVNFAEYGTQYSFYTFNGDATFAFSNLPTGRSIEFTLDITVDPTNTSQITILFPQVTNPPVLAGNPGDRDVLRFIGVNRTDPQGIISPVQTFTFLTGATTVLAGYSTIQDEGTGLTQRTTMNFIGSGVTAVDNPGQSRTDITITGGVGGLNTNLSNMTSPTQPPVDLNMNSNNIFAGGATKGMSNIGQLLFVDDNAQTPTANLAIYGITTGNISDLLVNTGGKVVNLSDIVPGKPQNLGDLTGDPDPFVVNFNNFDTRQLFANQIGDLTTAATVTISFANIPDLLSTNLKIYMTPAETNSSLTLTTTAGPPRLIYQPGGTAADDPFNILPLADNDFLSIEFESSDNTAITIISVKKNDEEEPVDVAPGIPGNIYAIGNTSTTAEVSWDQPEVGSLPILYTVVWSLDAGGSAATGPTNPVNQLTNIAENLVTAGIINPLVAATTYFFWVRGINAGGSGDFAGPQQTNTEGTTNPGNVNFAVTNVLFDRVTVDWDQPGTLLFTAFRTDSDGISNKVTFQTRRTTDPTITDTENIQPNTEYKWTLQTFNEFNVQLGTQTITDTTENIPIPVLTLSTVGRKLQFSVPIPAGINICQVEWDLVDTFDSRVDDLQMIKTVGKSTPQTIVKQTGELLAGTTFFVRARFQLNSDNGSFNATQNITTGTLSIPLKPEFDEVNISAQNFGIIKIGVDFANSSEVGETAVVTVRDSQSVGAFVSFPGMVWSRNNKPTDDLRTQEDEVLVVRGGGGFGAAGVITVVSGEVTNIDVTFGGQEYVNGQRIVIYDDNDFNYRDFEGTAIVSGGQLTGVNISNGGDNFDDQASVFLVGFVNSGIWFAGNELTFRVVAVNASGESPSDTEDHEIGDSNF